MFQLPTTFFNIQLLLVAYGLKSQTGANVKRNRRSRAELDQSFRRFRKSCPRLGVRTSLNTVAVESSRAWLQVNAALYEKLLVYLLINCRDRPLYLEFPSGMYAVIVPPVNPYRA